MSPCEPDDELLTIGAFARRARLSPKALRIYAELGLLEPASVDPANGYRYYREGQLRAARLIGLLRGTDMGLSDIAEILATVSRNPSEAAQHLARHMTDLESQHSSRRLLASHIQTILREEDHAMFTVQTRHVPAQRVMSIQRRIFGSETDTFIAEAKTAFRAHLGPVDPAGPFVVVFHGIVDDNNDGPIEAMLGCPDEIEPTDLIGIRTEPAHDVAYTTITKAQWDYPAIIAAYDAVACSPEAEARAGSSLSCREIYLAEPDEIGDDDLICDVAFPLA